MKRYFLPIFIALAVISGAYAASTFWDLPEETAPPSTDVVPCQATGGGATEKCTLSNLSKGLVPGNIPNTPAGDIAATDVQAAIDELDTEKSATGHAHTESDISDLDHEATSLQGGDALPGSCTGTAVWVDTDATSGQRVYVCESGTYVQQGGAGGGGSMDDLIDDTTPQLGGQLDVNGNAIGDGTNELLTFTEDASAVNEIQIENEAAGSGPIIRATGDDAAVELNLDTKGTADVNILDNLDVTGNLVISGTVDGRDIAADGTKLDGIESGATADQTAAEVANTPAGDIAATDVQAAINELDTEKSATGHAHTESDISDLAHTATAITDGLIVGADFADGDLGDVSANSGSLTIDAGVVDNTALADMAQDTIKGRVSSGTGVPEDLTVAQVQTLLGDAWTNSQIFVVDPGLAGDDTTNRIYNDVPTALTAAGSAAALYKHAWVLLKPYTNVIGYTVDAAGWTIPAGVILAPWGGDAAGPNVNAGATIQLSVSSPSGPMITFSGGTFLSAMIGMDLLPYGTLPSNYAVVKATNGHSTVINSQIRIASATNTGARAFELDGASDTLIVYNTTISLSSSGGSQFCGVLTTGSFLTFSRSWCLGNSHTSHVAFQNNTTGTLAVEFTKIGTAAGSVNMTTVISNTSTGTIAIQNSGVIPGGTVVNSGGGTVSFLSEYAQDVSGFVPGPTSAEISTDGFLDASGDWRQAVEADISDLDHTATAITDSIIVGADFADGDLGDVSASSGSLTLDADVVTQAEIADDAVQEEHLKAVDAPADEECLTYESTTGDFEWQACGGGSQTIFTAHVISSETLSGDGDFAQVAIPSGYSKIQFQILGRMTTAAAATNVEVSLNSDTTDANYHRQNNLPSNGSANSGEGQDRLIGPLLGASGAGQFGVIDFTLYAPDSSNHKLMVSQSLVESSTDAMTAGHRGIIWNNTAAVTTVDLPGAGGDDFVSGSSLVVYGWKETTVTGPEITEWADCTFASATWTTNTTLTCKKRIVDSEVCYQFRIVLAGAPNATTLTIDLPSGETWDSAQLLSTSDHIIGHGHLRDASPSNSYPLRVRMEDSNTVLPTYDSIASSIARLSAINEAVPITFASGDVLNGTFCGPQ